MNTNDLIEALEQRYGNPYANKEMALIQEAIKVLRLQSKRLRHC
jgi:coenzyme F420-reducing hydrogenase delta subunit